MVSHTTITVIGNEDEDNNTKNDNGSMLLKLCTKHNLIITKKKSGIRIYIDTHGGTKYQPKNDY